MANLRRWIKNNANRLGIGLFIVSLILNNLVEMPQLWGQIPLGWVVTALLLIVLNLHIIPQYWAKVWSKIKYRNLENYTCKNDYILPFAGKWCVFGGGPTKELSTDWKELILRYTYFFAIIDNNGKGCMPDDSQLENHYSYGKNILATSDGVVVKVSNKHVDGLHDKSEEATAYVGTADIMGNHIVIRHSKNEYSCVGNLMQHSATVKVGDQIKQGDVIAKCGNSGYLVERPCIQFQLQSSKSFNLSTSLPIAFSNINAADSSGYHLVYKSEGVKTPPTNGNLKVVGNKTYIGQGLDVENSDRQSEKAHGPRK